MSTASEARTFSSESRVGHLTSASTSKIVTRAQIQAALTKWGTGLVSIATAKAEGRDFVKQAQKVLDENYNYKLGPVLFKPTLAQENTFRLTLEGALSYFVGGNSKYREDAGFALNPWVDVQFEVANVIEGYGYGIVMGNKHLKNSAGDIVIANFTMGFVTDDLGNLKINLHHSSLPFKG
jgi:hypothetical protein